MAISQCYGPIHTARDRERERDRDREWEWGVLFTLQHRERDQEWDRV